MVSTTSSSELDESPLDELDELDEDGGASGLGTSVSFPPGGTFLSLTMLLFCTIFFAAEE